MTQSNVKLATALLLLMLIALLPGCATPSAISDASCPQLPQKPVASQPMPPSTYSGSAAMNIERWQKTLTDTQTTR